jgi:diguanylate cyclase (GGDEF)-like protein
MNVHGFVLRDENGKLLGTAGKVPLGLEKARVRTLDIVNLGSATESEWPRRLLPYPGGFLLQSVVPVKVGKLNTKGLLVGYTAVGKADASQLAKSLDIEVAFIYGAMVASASIETPDMLPNDGKFHVEEVNGAKYGMQYVVIIENDWEGQMGVMVMRSVKDATTVYRNLMTLFTLLMLAALIAGMFIAGHLAKGITKPLDAVVEAAREVQSGSWPSQLEVTANDELGLLQSVFNEMTDSVRASQQKLIAMIDVDPLTELLNHRAFKERLDQEVVRCHESGAPLSMLLIDVDEFKQFNEVHGHSAGDEILRGIARALEAATPEYAAKSRYGGEEFAIVLPNADLQTAESFAEAVRSMVSLTLKAVTVSVGCSTLGAGTGNPESLILASELALNRAKQLGRNRVCRFDSVPGADQTHDPYQLHKFLQDASLSTIQALAAAVDAKDTYTQGHSQRVAQYAADLATYVGRSQAEIDLIYRTGTLHDVGKIGVPDAILKKPDKLTDEERAVMETHPVLGEVIVRKAPQLEDTLPGVRHHHERWDGRGYPDGLAGERIPYMARVLALADTYDAMTSDRPYRKGLAVDFALNEIEKGAGSQFDPDLAPAFVAMMRAGQLQKAA